jgi:hypothetical protein
MGGLAAHAAHPGHGRPPANPSTSLPPFPTPQKQATKNLHAQLAVRTLAALAGYARPPSDDGATAAPPTPPCAPAQRALAALLTQTLAPRLADPDPLPLLRDLNSSLQTPQVGAGAAAGHGRCKLAKFRSLRNL